MKISWRRVVAAVGDFIVMFALFYAIAFIYNVIFVNNNARYQNNITEIREVLLESKLYQEKDGEMVSIDKDYDQALENFYNLYGEVIGDVDAYSDIKELSGLFNKQEDGSFVVKDGVSDTELTRFYQEELYEAQVLLVNHSNYYELLQYNNTILDIGGYVSIVLSNMVVYFVFPLILKRGQTLFKKICRVEVLSQDGKKLSLGQLLIRAWAMTFIVLLALNFYFLSILVAILVYIFNKKHRSVLDYCAVSDTKDIELLGGFDNEKERR